jgi:hypothetical protein
LEARRLFEKKARSLFKKARRISKRLYKDIEPPLASQIFLVDLHIGWRYAVTPLPARQFSIFFYRFAFSWRYPPPARQIFW